MGFKPVYHGTRARNLHSILKEGLKLNRVYGSAKLRGVELSRSGSGRYYAKVGGRKVQVSAGFASKLIEAQKKAKIEGRVYMSNPREALEYASAKGEKRRAVVQVSPSFVSGLRKKGKAEALRRYDENVNVISRSAIPPGKIEKAYVFFENMPDEATDRRRVSIFSVEKYYDKHGASIRRMAGKDKKIRGSKKPEEVFARVKALGKKAGVPDRYADDVAGRIVLDLLRKKKA
jgi:hypothetical protein